MNASEGADHREVLRLYGGTFLDGVDFGGCTSELEEWAYSVRDLLAGQAKTAQLALAEQDAARGEFQAAARQAEEALKIAKTAGLERDDIRRAHTLLLAGNHPRAVTLRLEAEDFGLVLCETPEEARGALHQLVHHRAAPVTNLGQPASSFVGRARELADLAALLARPEARLVTVVGGGGVGKTRLATESARRQLGADFFRDGVYVVALEAVSSSGLVPTKIAEALFLPPSGDAPLLQLKQYLGNKAALLVLDNLEHLLGAAPSLLDLLESCPRLKLLVTSREALGLTEEWLFEVAGLSFETSEASNHPLELEAATLFLERARQVQPPLPPDPATLQAVETICRLLQGYPLGLELAASLVRVLSCSELAAELGRDLDVLNVPRSAPERHRSLRVVFEHSWQLLSRQEQSVLRKLAVFRGGFTRGAAADVAAATIPVLLSLVAKSLLRVSEAGRYDRHPLVAQYTQEKLAECPEDKAEVAAKHAAFFSRFSADLRLQFNGPEPKKTLKRLEADFENCLVAWDWALGERDASMMLDFPNTFWFYYGNWEGSEAIHRWDAALEVLNESDPAQRRACGTFLALKAQHYSTRSFETAKPSAEHALALLRPVGNDLAVGMCLHVLFRAAVVEGHYDEARALMDQLGEHTVSDLRGQYPIFQAFLEIDQGNYSAAKKRLFEALAISRSEDFTRGIVEALNALGEVHLYEHDYETAQQYYAEALTLAREKGFEPGGSQQDPCLLGLGEVALGLGRLGEAAAFGEKVLVGQRRYHCVIDANLLLGRVSTARADYDGAASHLAQALQTLTEISGTFPNARVGEVSRLLLSVAELWLRQGKREAAAAVLGFLLRHLHVAHERAFAERLRLEIRVDLEEKLTAAFRAGERATLASVIQGFLARDSVTDASAPARATPQPSKP